MQIQIETKDNNIILALQAFKQTSALNIGIYESFDKTSHTALISGQSHNQLKFEVFGKEKVKISNRNITEDFVLLNTGSCDITIIG